MSEKIKGMFGSKTRADKVLAWLKSQGAEESAFDGDAENCIYFVDQGQVKIVSKKLAVLFDIVELPRWRAEKGETYYYVTNCGYIGDTKDEKGVLDEEYYRSGNYFKTLEEARPYAEKIHGMFKKRRGILISESLES